MEEFERGLRLKLLIESETFWERRTFTEALVEGTEEEDKEEDKVEDNEEEDVTLASSDTPQSPRVILDSWMGSGNKDSNDQIDLPNMVEGGEGGERDFEFDVMLLFLLLLLLLLLSVGGEG